MDTGQEHFEIVSDPQTLRSLQGEWEALSRRSKRSRFSQSFVWCWTSWETVERPRARKLHCVVLRRGERLVLLWPFTIRRKKFLTLAEPLGCAYSEYPDPLVEDGDEGFGRVKAAWQFLRSTCRCDLIILRHVPEGSLLHSVLQSGNAQPHSTLTNLRVSFDNHENWQSYYRSTPANDRRDNERRRRRLEERARVAFEVVEGSQGQPMIEWALKQKARQLPQDDRARRWLQSKSYRDLLVAVSSRGGPEGRLAIFVLKIDDAVAATIIGRVDQHRVEAMTTTYDATYREFAPGKLLLAECLKWAAHNKLEFDLRGGDFPYKRRWANRESMIHDYKHGNSAFYAISVRLPFAVPILRWCRRLAGQRRTTKSEETT